MRRPEDDSPDREPTPDEIAATGGPLVLQFGASWCGHCRALAPRLAQIMARYPDLPLRWIEDGRGQPLGRSFGVKLWPTLVFLHNGKVLRQFARPTPAEIIAGLEALHSLQR